MKRRYFISNLTLGSIAGMVLYPKGLQAWNSGGSAAADKLGRISISTWTFHNYFTSTREPEFKLPGEMLKLLDFPKMISDKYKVHNLELCAPHFDSTGSAYLTDLKARLAEVGSKVVNMPVDIDELGEKGGLSDPDKKVRDNAIKGAKKWIDIAVQIQCGSVRCDPGKMDPKNLAPTIDSYKQLSDYGRSKGVHVIIENHGGVGSEHPEELVAVFKGVGGGQVGALPDFFNFPDEATRMKGLELLFPYARVVCHAKGMKFDASGKETEYNFPKCIEISKRAGFKGVYSIEFEGPGDPYAGCQKVLDNLVKTI
ncbi:MAG TPA: TIM barrel protein [Terriglobia bacterium]|nr:TIM barrel protein [Terriglobia bacterium]